MKTVSIVIGVIALVVGVGYLVTNSNSPATPTPQTAQQPDEQPTEGAVFTTDSPDTAEPTTTEPEESADTTAAASPGTYATYDAERIAASDADHILLFFHATWCPSCRALDAEIAANVDALPPGVEIYKLDYDTETALKRQYGITTQHSVIKINADGTAVSGVSNPINLDALLATI